MGYLHNILIPYVNTTCIDLKLSKNHPCLVIFDSFKGQTTHILVVEIPPNCTDRLQPLELAVNKPLKDQMNQQFHHWYAEEIQKRSRTFLGETR